ncbi:MAG: dihydroorotate dehydrogenase [Candidatus Synechococcus spongiarum SP3]|uniref:Dihydroorotate dehydrogenase (quinone) n=1 Tax=Candidatus Synechococcus spongiarum SP3 TaxID=1604020 RepID=A0A0G2HLL6_9SYNE|nr:MAG: dihydroorotate dehydrogenase [Candidatus Synechococcus spongiarum SP3]
MTVDDPYQRLMGPMLARDDGPDPELMSQLSLRALAWAARRRRWPPWRGILASTAAMLQRQDPRLQQHCLGLTFPNPLGLAAGFDKNGVAAAIWHCFGFGFAELGTMTALPQRGNPRPRLFRLAAEQAALNRMGFNNYGSLRAASVLTEQQLPPPGERPALLGLNIGKSRATTMAAAAEDYAVSYSRLAPLADYVVVNVSSPNTSGLRDLQRVEALSQLIGRLQATPLPTPRPPLLVKVAPDLTDGQLIELAELALDLHQQGQLAGVIANNTSLDRHGLEARRLVTGRTLAEEAGGLSGAPIRTRSLAMLRQLRSRLQGRVPLVGVGGIDSPQAAWERLAAGASLLQLYTGWIYQGPQLVPAVLEGLLKQLDAHSLNAVADGVGTELPWLP